MRIVPVLDLKSGIVVHARRGQRDAYAPLRSPLVEGCEPAAVAQALCAACRTSTLYVADLDALAGEPADLATLTGLAAVAQPWVDAGATDPERAASLARAGVARNVVGTESLESDATSEPSGAVRAPQRAPGRAPQRVSVRAPQRVLSVDLRDGRLISPRPELAGRDPVAAAPLAMALGVRELLVIDLARVGSGAGPPLDAVAQLAEALPGLEIYAGGGVRDDDDLRALESAGATGALVATALHEGRVTP
jgi:phosphoribosylformimino-5-aminoimidazole carboxamide ribotide isomerase